ncbi:hypothetical protein MBLNU459_g0322t2 [Dothideomycetes sp. NU459]
MDFVKNFTGGNSNSNENRNTENTGVQQPGSNSEQSSSGGFFGGIGDKLNSAAGGGRESEKNEDYLDKGLPSPCTPSFPNLPTTASASPSPSPSPSAIIFERPRIEDKRRRKLTTRTTSGVDFVQEKFLGQGAQDNESAVEQAKDEQISDFIRGQYKTTTGSNFPVADKETRFG